MTKATVLVNRRARRLRDGSALLSALRQPRDGFTVVETRSLEDLDRAAVAIAADPPDLVVLAGGDGSYMAGVTSLVRAFGDAPLPPVALAPGGTVSTIARNWGLRGDWVQYTHDLLDAGAAQTNRRPTLRVRGGTEGRIGFIFGAGLVARFFEVYEGEGARGYGGAASIVARVFAGSLARGALARRILTPVRCRLAIDGAAVSFDRASLVCASVVRDLGLHLRLTYRAGEAEDRVHVVATPLGPSRLGPQLPLVLAGRSLLGRGVDTLARTLTLDFPRGEGAYVLDGELLRADAIDVRPGPVIRVVSV